LEEKAGCLEAREVRSRPAVGWLLALEDAVDVARRPPMRVIT
jgi:hypothetical protein